MIVNRPKKKKKMSRYTVMSIITGTILGSLTLRLLYLQVFSYEDYKEKANTTSTRFVSEVAPRGIIYDSNNLELATNKTTYSLTYTETTEVKEKFYESMTELFKILDENGESIPDSMLLKLDDNDEPYFAFTSESSHDYEELRFKKDRGFNDELINELYPNVDELSEEQEAIIDAKLLEITPEETFYKLVKNYNLIQLIDPEYNKTTEKKKEYENMTGEEVTQKILDAGYTFKDIKKYMLVKDIIKIQNLKGNKTVTIVSNVSKNTVLTVKQKLTDIPGIDVSSVPIRYYPYTEASDETYGNLASSVLGYVSSINSSEEASYKLRGYDASTDLIGKAGIEAAFEDQLKGQKGGTTVKVNSSGRVTEKLFELESYPGNNVHLTIDSGLQWAAEQSLKDAMEEIQQTTDSTTGYKYQNATRGALVALEVNTGKVLAMVSNPDYDANLFTIPGTLTQEQTQKYFSPDLEAFGEELIAKLGLDKTVEDLFPNGQDQYDLYPKPFYNYATMSLIPPGSTYKPLTAIAALESNVIGVNDTVYDGGKFYGTWNGKNLYEDSTAPKCWKAGGHGSVDVQKALAVSCNVYFYEVSYRMYQQALASGKTKTEALNEIANYAWQFGLGVDPNSTDSASTGIEISERFGQTYNFSSWKTQMIYYSKFTMVDSLEKGSCGSYTFVPMDIGVNEDDIDEVKNAKQNIKDAITNILENVDENFNASDYETEFRKTIRPEIEAIMEYSDKYKANVAEAEAKGMSVNLETQAQLVENALAQFTINSIPTEIMTPGQLIIAGIGQGMNNYTPLQLASYVSTIANGGTRYKVSLVDKVTDNNGNVIEEYEPEVLNTIDISDTTLAAVKAGMARVTEDQDGTASAKFSGFPIGVSGKTGTADFSTTQNEVGRSPYATFVSYAPQDNPLIAVVVVVFDGGHGGSAAGAARAVYDYYFRNELKNSYPSYTSEYYTKYVENNPFLDGKVATENDENTTEDSTNTSDDSETSSTTNTTTNTN